MRKNPHSEPINLVSEKFKKSPAKKPSYSFIFYLFWIIYSNKVLYTTDAK